MKQRMAWLMTICVDEVLRQRAFAIEEFHPVGIKREVVLFNSLEYCNCEEDF